MAYRPYSQEIGKQGINRYQRWDLVKYSTWYWAAAYWRLSSGFSR
nr:MAG TPA: hypothetical protein [Caudoviricetes sp.]